MRVTIYDLAPTIIDSPLRTLTLHPKSPVFKLRFHNSNSRLSKPSNNNGPCLSTRQLFTVPPRTSRPPAAAHPIIFTRGRLCRLKTFGLCTTRAFRHRRVPAIMVDSGSRHAGPMGLRIGGGLILRQDSRPSSGSPGVFGML